MPVITCSICSTRYIPPPSAESKFEKSCPDCRDKERHSAIEPALIADLLDCDWAVIEDWWV